MKKIKFSTHDISRQELSKIKEAIKTRWLTSGPYVREFEERVSEFCGVRRTVAFDSCTGAMEMSLRVLGIGPGDEVITTPYTYTATAEVIRNVGAKIVFVDLESSSFEMDYEKVAAAITEQTKAVMPVDIGGKMCDYRALTAAVISKKDIFKPNNDLQKSIGRVAIISDAAHSFGAELGDKVSGQCADFTCFSFHVLKCITTGGEGGAVVWDDFEDIDNEELESKFRLLGDHGQTSRDKTKGWEYDIAMFGYNSIMTNIDAAMGLAQLDRWDEIKEKRIEVTERYDSLFSKTDNLTPLIEHNGYAVQKNETGKSYLFDKIDRLVECRSSMHLYPIHIPTNDWFEESAEIRRNSVYNLMKEAGVPCNVHYKPLPMMTAYKNCGFDIEDYPRAFWMYAPLLTIPYHTELTAKEQEYIVSTLEKAVKICR